MADAKIQIEIPGATRSSESAYLKDPVQAFSFYVELNGILEAGFISCAGLNMSREVKPVQEGGVNDYVHALPGQVTFGKITLKQGITYSDALLEWFLEGAPNGGTTIKQVSIVQVVPYTKQVVRRYDLEKAFPSTWTGPDLDAGSDAVAVESLEITFARFTIQKG